MSERMVSQETNSYNMWCNLKKFHENYLEMLAEVPEQYKDDAAIFCLSEDGEMYISWMAPETEEQKQYREGQERAQLAQLLAKYGNS